MISDYTQHPRAHSSILIIAKKKNQNRFVGHNLTFYTKINTGLVSRLGYCEQKDNREAWLRFRIWFSTFQNISKKTQKLELSHCMTS